MRFILSIIFLALLITYAIIPAIKWIKRFVTKEIKRIDRELTNTKSDKEKDDEK